MPADGTIAANCRERGLRHVQQKRQLTEDYANAADFESVQSPARGHAAGGNDNLAASQCTLSIQSGWDMP
jgi:hypothetical protein